jgi:hypothetical protein
MPQINQNCRPALPMLASVFYHTEAVVWEAGHTKTFTS